MVFPSRSEYVTGGTVIPGGAYRHRSDVDSCSVSSFVVFLRHDRLSSFNFSSLPDLHGQPLRITISIPSFLCLGFIELTSLVWLLSSCSVLEEGRNEIDLQFFTRHIEVLGPYIAPRVQLASAILRNDLGPMRKTLQAVLSLANLIFQYRKQASLRTANTLNQTRAAHETHARLTTVLGNMQETQPLERSARTRRRRCKRGLSPHDDVMIGHVTDLPTTQHQARDILSVSLHEAISTSDA